MSGVRGLLGALVTGAVGVLVLIACGTSSEGTVVAKTDQAVWVPKISAPPLTCCFVSRRPPGMIRRWR